MKNKLIWVLDHFIILPIIFVVIVIISVISIFYPKIFDILDSGYEDD